MRPLRFTDLTIRRAPGFPGGGIRLERLSPAINLVHGPNASGKTTTAKALQHALWSDGSADEVGLEARVEFDEAAWLVDAEGRRRLWQRDGHEVSPPPLPPADNRDRYFLSLHDLLRAEDSDLAQRIHVESAGGYDVAAAAAALSFEPGGVPRNLVNELREAERALQAARTAEADLRDEARRLAELHERHDDLRRDSARAEALRRALAVARAREALHDAERVLREFPDGVALLTGGELERLGELEDTAARAREALTEARAEEERAHARLAEAGAGGEGIPAMLVEELEELQRRVAAAADQVRSAQVALGEAGAKRVRAEEALGIARDAPRPADPSAADLRQLDELVHAAGDLHARRSALTHRLRVLQAAAPPGEDLTERAAAGRSAEELARTLRHWLRAAAPDGSTARRLRGLLWIGVAGLLASGLLALALDRPVVLALTGAVALLMLVLRPAEEADVRERLQDTAARLGFRPDAWTPAAVENALDGCEDAIARARLAERRRDEIASLETERGPLEREEAELEARRVAVAGALGIDPAAGDLELHTLAGRIHQCEEARADEVAARAAVDVHRSELEAALTRAADLLRPLGLTVPDPGALLPALRVVRERRDLHREATAALGAARKRQAEEGRRLEGADEQRQALFDRLGLAPGQEHVLREWAERYEGYRAARKAADVAGGRLEQEAAHLDALDGVPPDLRDLAPADLEVRLAEAQAAAQHAGRLAEEIAGITARLSDARNRHDVQDALARVDEARAALADQRDADIDAAVGKALVEWLRTRAARGGRPAVFHRAQALFAEITRHRYQLDIGEGDSVSFRAIDSTTGRGHTLDQLSSGTRLQLLLAVRLAFVETQEAGAALPLLLDEVLANCDDHRATAIIQAAVAIARQGRQVFYFTAQADELAKWREALSSHTDVEWRVCSLEQAAGDGPSFDWHLEHPPAIPAPGTADHAEYGRMLKVPALDAWNGGATDLHVWYVVEDVHALHHLLERGITRWGQLELYARAAGGAEDELHEVIERARRTATLCERFLELWRHGRGRAVDRSVLAASGAVRETFIDRVSELAALLDGDGAALIAALEDGRVPRFRANSIEQLRAFLIEGSFISESTPHSPDDLRVMLAAEAATIAPYMSAVDCERLVGRLARGPRIDAVG